ncbi:Serpentine Receptor, class H [Caenorhabditis elegans]|uniref:Serpentine Receptor, class H n=1 Tax=Caenorhabditis elegans TaxID=6239 RepID=Q7YXA8_CAEEL|nr:Serpentine Receptor, class H [Caenorhabditis elegans]CAE11309.1 Serpentine Receptor, class H [Caenorhabditis elegans]|eukprot:NP_001256687.1 Serpentine Receptor, class H [Caenorhabditis elegans]
MCSTSLSSFASDEVYSKLLHTLTVIEIITHSFGAYIIISKTPKKFESVKAGMLFLHFAGAIVDLYFSLLSMPVILIPVCAGYSLGILRLFGVPSSVQNYMGVCSLEVMISTIVIFLEDRRYRLINGQKDSTLRKWYRLLFATLHYALALTFPVPVYLSLPNQEDGKLVSQNSNQCVPSDVFNNPQFFLLDLTGHKIMICILCSLSVLLFQMSLQFGLIFRQLLKHEPVSRNTQRLQHQFFIAMSLQVIIPIVIIAFPAFYFGFSVYFNYYNQGANNLTFILISIHGVLSTITMLMVHTPYRKSIIEMLHLDSIQSGGRARLIWKFSTRTSNRF